MIYNKLPRFPWQDGEVTIRNLWVRTDFSQKVTPLFVRTVFCQEKGLFSGFYETDGRFEPVASICLCGRQFLFQFLLSLDEFILSLPVFVEGKHLVEVRLHQAFKLRIIRRNL
ncbi:MAG: hypothetical protein ABSB74_17875 [Tepidisphaeraceae bacterium]